MNHPAPDDRAAAHPVPPTTPAARWLRRLVMVREGELPALLWSAAYFFFVLSSYYVLRPIREAMGIERSYDDLKWLMTATMGAMFLANPLFAAVASRWPRRTFIPLVYHFCALNLLLFWILFYALPDTALLWLGYAFYVWVSVFNLFAVSIFWAFMADLFDRDQSKRLFGFIAVGGTLGAMFGATLTGALVEVVGASNMFLASIVFLELAVFCVARLASLARRPAPASPEEPARSFAAPSGEPSPSVLSGITLIARSPYLLAICAYMLLFTLLSTFLYMEQARIVEAAASETAGRAKVFASIDTWTNAATLLIQALLTSRIVAAIGVGGTLAVLPVLTIAGFAGLAAAPTVAMVTLFQASRRALHYAVSRPAREMLFTVVGPDAKYKSKAFIDTFIYRGGDLIGAWSPAWLVKTAAAAGLPLPLSAFAIPLAAAWMAVGLSLGFMQRRIAPPTPNPNAGS